MQQTNFLDINFTTAIFDQYVYAQKSPGEHITETKLIITEIESQNSINELQRDASKVIL